MSSFTQALRPIGLGAVVFTVKSETGAAGEVPTDRAPQLQIQELLSSTGREANTATMVRPQRFIVLLAGTLLLLGCSRDSRPLSSLDGLLLEELYTHKIVMLGDSYHGHGYYERLVTGFLNSWLDELGKNEVSPRVPKKLVLFLEDLQSQNDEMWAFMKTGDVHAYLSYSVDMSMKWGGGFTIDRLEFFGDLKEILDRINDLNETRSSSDRLELRICAAESDPPFDYHTKIQLDEDSFDRIRTQWFANARDSLSSEIVRRELSRDTAAKALIFYGTGHLLRKQVDKTAVVDARVLFSEPIYGYFMAHYLDKLFGRDEVSEFMTSNAKVSTETFVKKIPFDNNDSDFEVHCELWPPSPSPLWFVTSKTLLRIYLEEFVKHSRSNTQADKRLRISCGRRLVSRLERSYLISERSTHTMIDSFANYALMRTDSGVPLVKAEELGHRLVDSFDATKNIDSIETWIARVELPDSTLYKASLVDVLSNLSTCGCFESKEIHAQDIGVSSLALGGAIPAYLRLCKVELQQYCYVMLLWYGTSEEREKAQESLRRSSGLVFETPKQWTHWWRSKYTSH